MRRLALIAALICLSVAGLTASASGDDEHTYFIEFDNAFGLVNGSEVKVAGVSAGTITDLYVNSSKRAVARVELSGPVAVLGDGTICRSEPQSLIAEYFVDCTPKGDPIEVPDLSDDERVEAPDIPVTQTRQTVQNDLVLSTLRLPFRERLTLLINEFGTALAGNGENLNKAIRRGAPALEQTRQVTKLLASQNTTIRDLNANSDRIIGRLAERRQDVVRFIEDAKNTAQIAAGRRDDLSQNFALLDDFLAELGPTMGELDNLAVQGTPLAADLREAAPGLTTLSRNLPAFNRSATDGLKALGNTSVVGRRALRKGKDEVKALAKASKKSFSVADNLSKFLRDIDDPDRAVEVDARANSRHRAQRRRPATPGWRGSSTTSTTRPRRSTSTTRSATSSTSRSSTSQPAPAPTTAAASSTASPACPTPTARLRPQTSSTPTAASPGSGATSRASTRTSGSRPTTAPSARRARPITSICDPSSSLAATAAAKASGKRARSGETAGGNAPGGGNPADGGGAPAGPGTPVVPGVPTTPAPGADPTPPAAPGAPSSPPGNDDLLGFLFGN